MVSLFFMLSNTIRYMSRLWDMTSNMIWLVWWCSGVWPQMGYGILVRLWVGLKYYMGVVCKLEFDAKSRRRSDLPKYGLYGYKYGKYGYTYGKYGQKYGKKNIENHIKLSKKKSSKNTLFFLHFINGYQSKIILC